MPQPLKRLGGQGRSSNQNTPSAKAEDDLVLFFSPIQWQASNGYQFSISLKLSLSTWATNEYPSCFSCPARSFLWSDRSIDRIHEQKNSQTEMSNECHVCGSPASKKCSGCMIVHYCTLKCQKADRVAHILKCANPGRPITSADHLALAVQNKEVPKDTQTIADYGFHMAKTLEDKARLLALYADLMEGLKVTPKTMHAWHLAGNLYKEIEEKFEGNKEARKSQNYEWFIANPRFKRLRGVDVDKMVGEAFVEAFHLTGGSRAIQSMKKVHEDLTTWSPERLRMWVFYGDVISSVPPQIGSDVWMHFGWCAGNEFDKITLLEIYGKLIRKASYDEFRDAYRDGLLVWLMDQHGLKDKRLELSVDVLDALTSGPREISDVWKLKTFVVWGVKKGDAQWELAYGFTKDMPEDDANILRHIHFKFFTYSHRRAFELAEAAASGTLYEYLLLHSDMLAEEQHFLKSILERLEHETLGGGLAQ